jgi:ferrous iron transport protein A
MSINGYIGENVISMLVFLPQKYEFRYPHNVFSGPKSKHLLIPLQMYNDNHSRLSDPIANMSSQPLSETPVGLKVRLVAIDGGRQLTRRLLALGLTLGSEVEVLHHRGRGVVVAKQGNRVALGKGIAEKLQAEILE